MSIEMILGIWTGIIGFLLFVYFGDSGKWVTVYDCKCGERYQGGVGNFSGKFFLQPELCDECGASKSSFDYKGEAKVYYKGLKKMYKFKEEK